MTEKADKKFLRQMAREIGTNRGKMLGFAVIFLALLFSFAIIVGLISPSLENIIVGELATETLTAPVDIEDSVTTEQLRQIAEDSVADVYVTSEAQKEEMLSNVSLFFSRLENARAFAEESYINAFNETVSSKNQISTLNAVPAEIDWTAYLSESDLRTICSLSALEYSQDTAVAIASLEKDEISAVAKKLTQILENHTLDQSVLFDEMLYRSAVENELTVNYFFSEDALRFAAIAIESYVKPYTYVDTEQTSLLKEAAKNAVLPIVYQQGQNITLKGEVVTEAQYAMLSELGYTSVRPITLKLYLSLFLFLLIIYMGFYGLITSFEPEYLKRLKHQLIIALVLVLAVAVMTLSELYNSEFLIILFATIMCTVLVGRRQAFSFNLLLAMVLASIVIWKKGQLSAQDFERVVLIITTGTAIPLFLKNTSHRSTIIRASFFAGLVGVVTIVSLDTLRSIDMHDTVMRSLWCLLSSVLNGIIAIGLLPLWEMLFGMATQTKLLELSNANRKLLQRLMQEAPGTFYHSSMVANLAERAADALGANALLVRAAALYHDVGKLENPEFFTENKSEDNPHENLTNIESAQIIIGHVEASVRMTKADGIPKDVIEIISQHHGNALIPNFYYKEKEINPKVDEDLFRYPFTKPTTKEAGIMMIADTVEAAMRSAGDMTKEEKKDRINSLIVEKFNHGLLDDCPLTRKELGICANIFALTLENATHKRVKYRYNLSGQVQK